MTPIENCPKCSATLEVPDEQVGGRVECPDCGHWFEARALTGAPRVRDRNGDEDEDRSRLRSGGSSARYCSECGAALGRRDRSCPECDAPVSRVGGRDLQDAASKKLSAGLCGILLNCLGIHKFILGYTNAGIIMLLVSLVGGMVTCGASSMVMSIIGIVEGIIYLTKSDQEFYDIYIRGRKEWF